MALDPAGWLDKAQALAEGERQRTTHDCGDGTVLVVDHKRNGWGAWCHRCNDRGWIPRPRESLTQRLDRLRETRAVERSLERDVRPPSPANHDIQSWPLEARVWLYKAGLSNARIRELGWYHHDKSGRVVLLIRERGSVVYWQARGFDPERPKYLNPEAGKAVFRAGCGPIICITEDILSAVRVGDSGAAEGWCIMGTSIPEKVLLELLQDGRTVRVWLDPDAAGDKGARKFVPKLRALGIDAKALRSEKDPKLHSREEILAVIRPDTAASA